jgi:hypothetical protein
MIEGALGCKIALAKIAVFERISAYIFVSTISGSLFIGIPISTCFNKVDIHFERWFSGLTAGFHCI